MFGNSYNGSCSGWGEVFCGGGEVCFGGGGVCFGRGKVCFGRGDWVESRGGSRSCYFYLYRNSILVIKIF